MLNGFSSIFSSSIIGDSLASFSSKVMLWKQLDCRSYQASCSLIILLSFSDGIRSFLRISSQKKSMAVGSFLGSGNADSFLVLSLSLTRLNNSSIPQSSLIFFITFLCLKQNSFFLKQLQRYYNQSLSLTSALTRVPTQTNMYLIDIQQQIFLIFMLQKSRMRCISLAHLLMELHNESMLVSGGSKRIMLPAKEKAFRIAKSRFGQKSVTKIPLSLRSVEWNSASGGWSTTTSPMRSKARKSILLNSILLSTSQTLALFSKNPIRFLLSSLAITFPQEFAFANLIELPPTPAKASIMILAPLHLLARYSETCSGGFRVQEFQSNFIPSSNFSKRMQRWSQCLLNQKSPYFFCSHFCSALLLAIYLFSKAKRIVIFTRDTFTNSCRFLAPADIKTSSGRAQTGQSSSSVSHRQLQPNSMLTVSLNSRPDTFVFRLSKTSFFSFSWNSMLFMRLERRHTEMFSLPSKVSLSWQRACESVHQLRE